MMTYGEAEVIYKSKSACSATPAPKAAKQQGKNHSEDRAATWQQGKATAV